MKKIIHFLSHVCHSSVQANEQGLHAENAREPLQADTQKAQKSREAAAAFDQLLLRCARNGIKYNADTMRQNGLNGATYDGIEV
jgi:hypothetical protein